MYIKRRKNGSDLDDTNANGLLNWTMLIFAAVSIAGWSWSEKIVPAIYPVMSEKAAPIAIEITEVFFIFMTFIALAGLLESYFAIPPDFRSDLGIEITGDADVGVVRAVLQ